MARRLLQTEQAPSTNPDGHLPVMIRARRLRDQSHTVTCFMQRQDENTNDIPCTSEQKGKQKGSSNPCHGKCKRNKLALQGEISKLRTIWHEPHFSCLPPNIHLSVSSGFFFRTSLYFFPSWHDSV